MIVFAMLIKCCLAHAVCKTSHQTPTLLCYTSRLFCLWNMLFQISHQGGVMSSFFLLSVKKTKAAWGLLCCGITWSKKVFSQRGAGLLLNCAVTQLRRDRGSQQGSSVHTAFIMSTCTLFIWVKHDRTLLNSKRERDADIRRYSTLHMPNYFLLTKASSL